MSTTKKQSGGEVASEVNNDCVQSLQSFSERLASAARGTGEQQGKLSKKLAERMKINRESNGAPMVVEECTLNEEITLSTTEEKELTEQPSSTSSSSVKKKAAPREHYLSLLKKVKLNNESTLMQEELAKEEEEMSSTEINEQEDEAIELESPSFNKDLEKDDNLKEESIDFEDCMVAADGNEVVQQSKEEESVVDVVLEAEVSTSPESEKMSLAETTNEPSSLTVSTYENVNVKSIGEISPVDDDELYIDTEAAEIDENDVILTTTEDQSNTEMKEEEPLPLVDSKEFQELEESTFPHDPKVVEEYTFPHTIPEDATTTEGQMADVSVSQEVTIEEAVVGEEQFASETTTEVEETTTVETKIETTIIEPTTTTTTTTTTLEVIQPTEPIEPIEQSLESDVSEPSTPQNEASTPSKDSDSKLSVTFGPVLSPEIFDSKQPPSTPVRKGGQTPVRVSSSRRSILKTLSAAKSVKLNRIAPAGMLDLSPLAAQSKNMSIQSVDRSAVTRRRNDIAGLRRVPFVLSTKKPGMRADAVYSKKRPHSSADFDSVIGKNEFEQKLIDTFNNKRSRRSSVGISASRFSSTTVEPMPLTVAAPMTLDDSEVIPTKTATVDLSTSPAKSEIDEKPVESVEPLKIIEETNDADVDVDSAQIQSDGISNTEDQASAESALDDKDSNDIVVEEEPSYTIEKSEDGEVIVEDQDAWAIPGMDIATPAAVKIMAEKITAVESRTGSESDIHEE